MMKADFASFLDELVKIGSVRWTNIDFVDETEKVAYGLFGTAAVAGGMQALDKWDIPRLRGIKVMKKKVRKLEVKRLGQDDPKKDTKYSKRIAKLKRRIKDEEWRLPPSAKPDTERYAKRTTYKKKTASTLWDDQRDKKEKAEAKYTAFKKKHRERAAKRGKLKEIVTPSGQEYWVYPLGEGKGGRMGKKFTRLANKAGRGSGKEWKQIKDARTALRREKRAKTAAPIVPFEGDAQTAAKVKPLKKIKGKGRKAGIKKLVKSLGPGEGVNA